jgi:hypothetical protein
MLNLLLGALVGSVFFWAAFTGITLEFRPSGKSLRSTVPRSSWARSALVAGLGAAAGIIVAWKAW